MKMKMKIKSNQKRFLKNRLIIKLIHFIVIECIHCKLTPYYTEYC